MADQGGPLSVLVVGVAWPLETFLNRLLSGLADRGAVVTLASTEDEKPAWTAHPRRNWLHLGKLAKKLIQHQPAIGTAKTILEILGARFDVIYCPWNATVVSQPYWFDLGVPVVISCRGAHINVAPHNPERRHMLEGLPMTFERAAAVHCVSEAISKEAARYGLDRAKARVIRPAVDPLVFHPLGEREPSGRLRLISTGSLIWRKGIEYTLIALRRVLDQGVDAELELIGQGPDRERVVYSISDMALTEHVHLSGSLPPIDVHKRLAHADVFVLSSLSEGISNAVLEAMATELAVVTSNAGGIEEVITDGVEGYVVPLRDPERMADRIVALAKDPDLRHQMGKRGRLRVLEAFRTDQQVEAFFDLLSHAAGRAPHHTAA